ncbi:GntR family transcriptional regulator [Cryobacterium sp. Hh7]|uniref:GntR family transcriptional regulator n=1 Tax=Cryobacterium sp. Hh7 TaxID=1259159 RepID=UPI00141B1CC6|nr:GntR family transcriptional regulator [Cryobacterium sp. Hh7]
MTISFELQPGQPLLAKRVSLRARVTEALRESLVAGEMQPGRIYSAPNLAEMLGVSATPVREAMIDLAREGLVEPIRNKGYFVVKLRDEDLDDLTALRALIEVPTIATVATLITSDQIVALRPLARQLNSTAISGDLIDFIRTDTTFHLQLLAIAGNRQIVEEVRRLRNLSRLYGLGSLAESGELIATAQEHTELLDLLEEHDVQGSQDLMNRHLGHIRGVWAGVHEE